MPAATQADVSKVNDAITGIGSQLDELKQLYDSIRSGAAPASAPAAAAPAKTNWTPILLLAGAGLILFLLIKKGAP
jgi:hypothetical protein